MPLMGLAGSPRPETAVPSRRKAGRAAATSSCRRKKERAKACILRLLALRRLRLRETRPRLVRVRDPFAKLPARCRVLSACSIPAPSVQAAAEGNQESEQ